MKNQCKRKTVDALLDRDTVPDQRGRALLAQYFLNTLGAHHRRIDSMRNGVLQRVIRIAKVLRYDLPENQMREVHEKATTQVCMDVISKNDYSNLKKYPRPPLGPVPSWVHDVSTSATA